VKPVVARRFPMTMGQRLDIRLTVPRDSDAFPILALREGAPERTGIILKPTGKYVEKIPVMEMRNGPILDLGLESSLRALAPLAAREATRRYDVALTGGMEGYVWAMAPDNPIAASKGDRIELQIRNRTVMAHPIHLHGHHFQVVGIDDQPALCVTRYSYHQMQKSPWPSKRATPDNGRSTAITFTTWQQA
jgi:FtsP/CotA-like multicopper oxidase with cupredoxin domain